MSNICIETVKANDGYNLKIKVSSPDSESVGKLVIYVNGSGPNTYDNTRKWMDGKLFRYHDLFADEFCKRGIAYCSYNTRGVDIGTTEPWFADISDDEFKKYLPSNSVKDVEAIVSHFANQPKYKNAKVFLLGWSEGTIIAPLVALNNSVRIDALLLAGYCNENLKDTLTWQLSGNSELTIWLLAFDYDKKGYITKEDFEADKYKAKSKLFGKKAFEDIDVNCDGKIDIEDAAARSLPHLHNMLKAIESNDDEWLKKNHGICLTTGWFKEHFALKPTKDILPLLDLPIYIFQGEIDTLCPAFYAEDIKKKFDELEKGNLTVSIFEKHDHDLNYVLFLLRNEISKGINSIFDTVYKL